MKTRRLSKAVTRVPQRGVQSLGLGILLLSMLGTAHALDTRPYFPLDLGSTWTIRGTTVPATGDAPPPYQTVSTMVAGKVIGGKRTTRLSWVTDADDTDRVAKLFVQDASGTLLAAMEQMEPHPMKAECLPVPKAPHVVLPARVTVGQTFTSAMTSRCDGAVIQVSITSTIVGFSTVVVPAGTFRALGVKSEYVTNVTWQGKTMPPSKQVETMYLARGVGFVKGVAENVGSGKPYERSVDTEVLLSTNRKYDASGAKADE